MYHTIDPRPDAARRNVPRSPVPNLLPAFPNAVRVVPKGGRARWRDRDGSLLEWECRDAALDLYGPHGWHLGEFDFVRGANLKAAEPRKRIEP